MNGLIHKIKIKSLKEVQELFAGAYHSVFKGQGLDFEEIREYQPGDEIRYIDWNATARSSTPFVKQFREERELTVFLLVDISASTLFGSKGTSKSQIISEVAALLAFSAIQNRDKVGLILFSNEVELYLPPRKTLKQAMRIIREVLYFRPKHKGTRLSEVLSFLGQVQRKPCICFIMSDFLGMDFDHHLTLASKKHDLIAVKMEDPAERHFPNYGLIQLVDLESGQEVLVDSSQKEIQEFFASQMAKKEQDFMHSMGKLGIDRIVINTTEPYQGPLRQFFKMRRKHAHRLSGK